MSTGLIPEGYYRAVAIARDVQWGEAKTGAQQIAVPFQILDGDHRGRVLTYFGYFTDKTTKRTMESLRYCGWKGNDLTDLGDLTNEVELVVEHSEYEGKVSAKIAWVNRVGGGKVTLNKPMTPTELRQFAARMKAYAAQVPEVEGEPAAVRGGGNRDEYDQSPPYGYEDDPGPAVDDDGIPF